MILELNCLRYTTDDAEKIAYLKSLGATEIGSSKDETDYENMKLDDLKKLAKDKGIGGYLDMKKSELINALRGV
ncbi:hypothetical protein HMPREF9629_00623 [Peptoanaerobacter stomatis]|jgi:Rho termination factor, N-terminal domain.|uniref:Rho termination factor-like N-terminal domain-containing protein n=1 Tax=Peptoanaerobacter stomatis TaxID=796937 RepID=G9X2L6_9FIRM|nr:Rho termination factor N-terminal domain-containing protein [Peptoanaerobacter stomatis]EHL11086.1 hypothetical protein HMPREF9629_00623 [Peptoanaerobacter stomatis]